MNYSEKASLFDALQESLAEIDLIFKDHGFDPSDFDEDALDIGEVEDYDVATAYGHVHKLKTIVEA